MSFIKKNYKSISIVFLVLAVYVILFPLISKMMGKINPVLVRCSYLARTGNPCHLCGGTRYIAGLGQVFSNPSYLFRPFGYIMMFIFFEVIFRIVCLIKIKKGKELNTIIIFDIIIHIIAFLLYVFYVITFYIN